MSAAPGDPDGLNRSAADRARPAVPLIYFQSELEIPRKPLTVNVTPVGRGGPPGRDRFLEYLPDLAVKQHRLLPA